MQSARMHAGAAKLIFQRAVELRDNVTHAEELLWNYVRTKPLGYKFRRQHPFSIYILDFYCHALKLVIEVDGGIHNETDVKEADRVRQESLEAQGLMVVRFTNDEITSRLQVMIKKLEAVVLNRAKPVL